jgi:HAD superfamily hydrolase (TIGR01509 family)
VIRAVIFDFDGLILDTEFPIFAAWSAVFEAHDAVPLTIEEWAEGLGTTEGVDVESRLRERAGRPVDFDAANQARRMHRDAMLELERALPGVEAWLDEAEAAGYGVAIASSSPDDWVHEHLDRIGLRARFPTIVTAGGPLRSKPAPDTYLEACARLGVGPHEALALEDSPNGIAAAKAAGLRCVTVPHPLTENLDLSAADLRLRSLAQCTLADALAQLDAPPN